MSDAKGISVFSFWTILGFLAVSLTTGVVSCIPKNSRTAGKKIFRYNEPSNVTSLDPAFARDQANIWVVSQLYNGLVQLDHDLIVRPCIAKSWSVSEDCKQYVFHLRDDVFFHDSKVFNQGAGRKVVAEDFVFSLKRILDPKTLSPGSWVLRKVAFIEGEPAIIALNDSTLQITLETAFPPFLALLSMQYCCVVPREAVSMYGPDFRRIPVGTGPFMLAYWKEGVKLVLVKNKNYFESSEDHGLPLLDAVAVTFLADKQTAFLEFVKGNLDFISGIDASYKDEILTRSGELNPRYEASIELNTQSYLNTEYLAFQINPDLWRSKNNPLLLKEIRQAINYGIDRQKMMRFLRNNIGYPGVNGFIPPGLPDYGQSPVRGYDYNPEKAKELLNKAGFPNGRGLPEITLFTNHSYLDLTKYLQHALGELGIKISIEVTPPATLREMIAKGKIEFFRASWIADYPDPENFLSLFYSANRAPAGPNYSHFSDKNYDFLYQQALSIINDSLRYLTYRKMDSMVMEQAPVLILYYDQVLRFTRKGVTGFSGNAMNLLHLKYVDKKPDE